MSDSPQQINKQGADHFLADVLSFEKIDDLGRTLDLVDDENTKLHTLYLSAGLAGTEVALLAAISGKISHS